jgi:sterol desaturase/sphingolipid hydroxylase (fatty acid hydroxylase superfamily)
MFYISYIKGLFLGSFIFLLGRTADISISADSYFKLMKENEYLLRKGLNASFFNLVCVGPVVYCFVDYFLIDKTFTFYFSQMISILSIHSVGYYLTHRAFHENKSIYKYHSFHHKFDNILVPSIGNAVSIQEFFLAYMFPFILGAYAIYPTEISFISAVGLISIFNLIIHTKELEDIQYLDFLVSPKKHITHHKVKKKHYAAPIMDLDYILEHLTFKKNNKK